MTSHLHDDSSDTPTELLDLVPHPSTPPKPVPPPSPTATLPLDFVLVSFIVAPIDPSPHYPLPTPLWLLLHCSEFQCLWLYFVHFFLLLIMFQLKVRSHGIHSNK